MKLHHLFPTIHTKHRVYFKDPVDAALQLGLDTEAARVSGEKLRDAARALKDRVKLLSGAWPKHDSEHNRYYLDVGDPWDDRLKDLVDTQLTYQLRKTW